MMFGTFTNFAIYNCFMTGIYTFRATELMEMRKLPLPLKLGVSSIVSFIMCKKLWEGNIYEAELYQVAIKYRINFDK